MFWIHLSAEAWVAGMPAETCLPSVPAHRGRSNSSKLIHPVQRQVLYKWLFP